MLKIFERIRSRIDRPSHVHQATTDSFPELDVQRIATEAQLALKGTANGANDRPVQESQRDQVETEIINIVSAAQKRAHDQVENHIAGFQERITDLDFDGLFSEIASAAGSATAELKAELQKGLDELHELRRDVNESEKWRRDFRAKNRLSRPCRTSKTPFVIFKWLVIVALVVIELVINGELLAKNNELGLIGGIVEASLFAILNVGLALLLGVFAIPQLNHRSAFRKLVGVLGLLAYLICAFSINLALAHYREVAGALTTTNAGKTVLENLRQNPFELTDFRSWLLFVVGVVFSLIALIDALYMRDPYPGYSAVEKHLRRARTTYRHTREALIQELQDVRQDYEDVLTNARSGIHRRRTEHAAIIDHRQRLIALFREYQNHLEKDANLLLAVYYDANKANRSTPRPVRFDEPYQLQRIDVHTTDDAEGRKQLETRIAQAMDQLSQLQTALNAAFEDALEQYRKLDVLVEDEP